MILASGAASNHSYLFYQSAITYHLKLHWLLSCCTSNNWINRMPQYKQKQRDGMIATLGLYAYPILMAADILIYNAQIVPVGEDQNLHMELARQLADRLNQLCKREVFVKPEYFTPPYVYEYRVMSLQDGRKKMSKSSGGDDCTVYLNDKNEVIEKKIMNARVDNMKRIYCDKENRPEVTNLMKIFAAAHNMNIKELETLTKNMTMLQFKAELSRKLIEM